MRGAGSARGRVATFLSVLVSAAIASPHASAVNAADPDPKAVLAAAREAVAKLKSLSCVTVFESSRTGPDPDGNAVAGPTPVSRSASFSMQRVEAGGWAFRVKGSLVVKPGDGKGGTDGKDVVSPADGSSRDFEVAYDSSTARSVRDVEKSIVELSSTELDDLRLFFMAQDAGLSVPWELIEPTPMPAPLAHAVTLDGTSLVGVTACDVVTVHAPTEGMLTTSTRYFISPTDHLPRKIERVRRTAVASPTTPARGSAKGEAPREGEAFSAVQSLTLTELTHDEALPGSMFVLSVPDGHMVKAAGPKKAVKKQETVPRQHAEAPRESGLLALGSEAPAWTLKNSTSKVRTLAGYRGKVVVMDFWGTWCPWCVKAMPAIQKVHEKFKDKPVAILGMNYEGDPKADPMAFMKKNGFTYEVIFKAETIAEKYKVRGWPTLYVIGADGKVLFAESGFSPDLEAKLTEVIEKGLKDTGL